MTFKTLMLPLLLCLAGAAHAQAQPQAQAKLYTVVDGYKVDAETMKVFRAWRAAACDRCHGANQEEIGRASLGKECW